jgi:HEPN domain-containing protein
LLIGTLRRGGIEIPDFVDDAVILTDYSVETRYPGDYEEVIEEDYKTALEIAGEIFHWVNGIISTKLA